MPHKMQSTIVLEMAKGFSEGVAEEICEHCIRNGTDIYSEFINISVISGDTYKKWTTRQAKEFLDKKLAYMKANTDDMMRCKAALALMNRYFITTAENGSTLYKVTDGTNMLVEPCCPNNVSEQVGQTIKHELFQQGRVASGKLVKSILDLYRHNGDVKPSPKLWAQHNEPVYCLARAMVRPDASVPYPHIQAFLDRLNDAKALSAYLYGIYSGRNRGRQCLYLSEETGESGKSSFMRSVQRLFGDDITAALNGNIMADSTHASAHFAGKKFVVIGDNKNPNLLMSQAVKELSGDDKVMINPKYEAVYSTYLQCRLAVLSNMPPNITSERHNQTRTLWITLAPLTDPVDPKFADHYDDEMPGFLAYAQRCYEELCPEDYEVRVNEAVKEAVNLRVIEYEAKFNILFDTHLIIDPKGSIKLAEFNQMMDNLKLTDFQRHDLLLWIGRMFFGGNMQRKRSNQGIVYTGLRMKNSHDRRADERLASERTIYDA